MDDHCFVRGQGLSQPLASRAHIIGVVGAEHGLRHIKENPIAMITVFLCLQNEIMPAVNTNNNCPLAFLQKILYHFAVAGILAKHFFHCKGLDQYAFIIGKVVDQADDLILGQRLDGPMANRAMPRSNRCIQQSELV